MTRRSRLVALVAILAVTAAMDACSSGSTKTVSPVAQQQPSITAVRPTPTASPTATAPTNGAKGCDLVSQTEAETAAGVSLGPGSTDPYTLTKTIIAHSGCRFHAGTKDIAFDINTIAPTIPIAQYASTGWAPLLARGGKAVTIDGHAGVTITIGKLQDAAFYAGQISVIVSAANVTNPDAALAVAKLIGNRL
jgi:hypothetical protein